MVFLSRWQQRDDGSLVWQARYRLERVQIEAEEYPEARTFYIEMVRALQSGITIQPEAPIEAASADAGAESTP